MTNEVGLGVDLHEIVDVRVVGRVVRDIDVPQVGNLRQQLDQISALAVVRDAGVGVIAAGNFSLTAAMALTFPVIKATRYLLGGKPFAHSLIFILTWGITIFLVIGLVQQNFALNFESGMFNMGVIFCLSGLQGTSGNLSGGSGH